MKKAALAAAALGAVTISALAAAVVGSGPSAGTASSHREAPLISEDPSADNTDPYAFRSPDKPSTVTIVANWIPAEDPAAGPNYYTFSPSAKYKIIDRTGDARPDIVTSSVSAARPGRRSGQHRPELVDVAEQAAVRPREDAAEHRPAVDPNYRNLAAKAVEQGGISISPASAMTPSRRHRVDLRPRRFPQGHRRQGRRQGISSAGYAVHAIALQIPDLGAAG